MGIKVIPMPAQSPHAWSLRGSYIPASLSRRLLHDHIAALWSVRSSSNLASRR